jgi:GTP cyclohydrolase I
VDEKVELIAEKYEEIMRILGIKENADNKETPLRVAKSLIEMTRTLRSERDWGTWELEQKCTTFKNESGGIELVQDNIEFSSMCSHHHLPFFGKVKITYIPSERIIGLSKFNRIVDFFAKKPQVQEELTRDIGYFIVGLLSPRYLEVEIYDAMHTCMVSRGVHSRATTSTKFVYGTKKIPLKVMD